MIENFKPLDMLHHIYRRRTVTMIIVIVRVIISRFLIFRKKLHEIANDLCA